MAVTNAVSWRSEGIKHRKNEIFLDVVEKLNLLVSANGTVLRSEILGSLQMRSYLSGMPVRAPFSLSCFSFVFVLTTSREPLSPSRPHPSPRAPSRSLPLPSTPLRLRHRLPKINQ